MQRQPMTAPRWMAWLMCSLGLGVVQAQTDAEAALKAAVIFNMLYFVEWPDEANWSQQTPLHLCANRQGVLWNSLQMLKGRSLGKAYVEVIDAHGGDAPPDCQVIVVESPADAALQAESAPRPVLVVGDEGSGAQGVVLALQMSAGRVVFDANLALARRNGLRLSSRLLRLARSVQE